MPAARAGSTAKRSELAHPPPRSAAVEGEGTAQRVGAKRRPMTSSARWRAQVGGGASGATSAFDHSGHHRGPPPLPPPGCARPRPRNPPCPIGIRLGRSISRRWVRSLGTHCPSTFTIPRGHARLGSSISRRWVRSLGTHCPSTFTIPRGHVMTELTHSRSLCTVPAGQTQAVPAAFGINGGRHSMLRGAHSLPCCTVPDGQTHTPGTGPWTIGGGQACGTHSLPCCTVPDGQRHTPGTAPGTIGGGQVSAAASTALMNILPC